MVKLLEGNAVSLLALLPETTTQALLTLGKSRHYQAGDLVQQRGDASKGISILEQGRLVAGNVGLNGDFFASAVLNPGECYGEFTLFAGIARTHELRAQEKSRVLHISEKKFMPFFESEPSLAKALLNVTLKRNHELLEYLDTHRRLPLEARAARILLTAGKEHEQALTIECRQDELSYLLGVSRVSTGKALKKLEKLGLIKQGYGFIAIDDVEQVRTWLERQRQLPQIG